MLVKSLLFGGTGFLGINLAFALTKHGKEKVTIVGRSIHCDLRADLGPAIDFIEATLDSYTDFDALVKGHDVVYHMISSTVPATSNRQISDEISDIAFSARLFDACIRQGVKKIVYFSSGGAIYGVPEHNPVNESAPLHPVSSYGYQKQAIEELLALYGRLYDIEYRIVRISNPFGPYQTPYGKQGIIPILIRCALLGIPFPMRGDGTSIRDYIFVDDAINAIITVVNKDAQHSVYNIGSGKGMAISEIVSIVGKALDRRIEIAYEPSRPSDIDMIWLDISRYQNEFGTLAVTPFEVGIRRTASFLLQESILVNELNNASCRLMGV